MTQTGEVKVSERGQMALPAQTRHRWGLDEGGVIGWIDLGDSVVLVPGGLSRVRDEVLANADWEAASSGFGDPELANQQLRIDTLTVLIDDQTLSGLLRGATAWPEDRIVTTGCWYLRLCQAAIRGAGGALSRPLMSLPPSRRESVLRSVLQLPERIELLNWRDVAPTMASQLDGAGRGLNLLSREALAAATVLRAQVIMARGNENGLLLAALLDVGLG